MKKLVVENIQSMLTLPKFHFGAEKHDQAAKNYILGYIQCAIESEILSESEGERFIENLAEKIK